jgi:hypothetical protein
VQEGRSYPICPESRETDDWGRVRGRVLVTISEPTCLGAGMAVIQIMETMAALANAIKETHEIR